MAFSAGSGSASTPLFICVPKRPRTRSGVTERRAGAGWGTSLAEVRALLLREKPGGHPGPPEMCPVTYPLDHAASQSAIVSRARHEVIFHNYKQTKCRSKYFIC